MVRIRYRRGEAKAALEITGLLLWIGGAVRWVEIDHATREQMVIAFAHERDYICGRLTQMAIDCEHFNKQVNPSGPPIEIVFDFRNDVAEGLLLGREFRPSRDPRT